MAQIVESHADTTHDSLGILNANFPHIGDNLKSEWDDASTYQGKEHIRYLDSGCSREMTGYKSL